MLLDLTAGFLAFGVALAGAAKATEDMITNAINNERVLSFGRVTDVIVLLPS